MFGNLTVLFLSEWQDCDVKSKRWTRLTVVLHLSSKKASTVSNQVIKHFHLGKIIHVSNFCAEEESVLLYN